MTKRLPGEPLDNYLGYRSFFGRDFTVNTDVLSPRDDTETLVWGVLPYLKGLAGRGAAARVLDLGTGSGALAVTLALECAKVGVRAEVVATDVSEAALSVARGNAAKLLPEQEGAEVRFHSGDWFGALPENEARFDLIVSNPPYITDAVMETLEVEVRDYDPDISLRGGADGLVAYRAILAEVRDWLVPGGMLSVEIGYDQGESVPELFRAAGLVDVRVSKDLAGHDRVVEGRNPV